MIQRRRIRARHLAATALVAGFVAAPLGAQSVEAGYTSAATDYWTVGRLGGPTFQLAVGDASRRVRLVAGFEHLAGTERSTGYRCDTPQLLTSNWTPGPGCAAVSMGHASALTLGSVGPRVALLRRTRFELAGFAMGRIGALNVDASTGGDSGTDGNVTVFGGDVGALATWQPLARFPLAATVAYSTGALRPQRGAVVSDQPITNVMRVSRLQVGLAWR